MNNINQEPKEKQASGSSGLQKLTGRTMGHRHSNCTTITGFLEGNNAAAHQALQ